MNTLLEINKPIALESMFNLPGTQSPGSWSGFSQNQQANLSSPDLYTFPIALDNYINIKFKIEEFAELSENWDNFGASIVSLSVISNAKVFIRKLPPFILSKLSVDDVTPTNYGTIVIDWYDSNENFVSIEIGKTKMGGFYEFGGKTIQLNDESIDTSDSFGFLNVINRLYKNQFAVNA